MGFPSRGRPITHKNSAYNCRVIVHDGKIVMIRPKMWMANDGNYVGQSRCPASLKLLTLPPSGSLDTSRPGMGTEE